MDEQEGHHAISHRSVFGEAVDDSPKWVRVEEKHWSTNYPSQHGEVEGVAQVHKHRSDKKGSESRNAYCNKGYDLEILLLLSAVLLGERN